MTAYPVRCCCQPQKILGWLDLPEGLAAGTEVYLQPRLSLPPIARWDYDDQDPVAVKIPPPEVIKLRAFGRHDPEKFTAWEIAVYSDDRPLSFWREVPGFTENAMFSDDEIRAELQREVAMRIAVYRKKDGGRLGSESLRRIALMKAAAIRFGASYRDPWENPDEPV